ncbi:MAG: phosphate acyltransferase PlsX [SAR324 cluster bacterium]|jgi:glycerol-3-phosphate acyltransferase PlsX|uniref:phosphate acyltransferase n=1 Tax=marine metagenome TaxID=408172 RepID=A0A381NYR2_9ZZZZ|nr:phosphate--acyl-ACP acyltransferase [Deltaproteobacteria bacterium]MDP6487706.1 phosphate acyltransferase PlsX [SAR324 cluster bacterium]MDP7614207.1 phosphate acyltransferase PlsX [SAR324 cluster bacterium]HBR59185.1 phosphate acyltransferase PlsX [Deltaproteobacteria bacterium]|tara:strand:- start:279 stop:1319 length:1041 start_codon:yes stop_codon:yes gene_type:complete
MAIAVDAMGGDRPLTVQVEAAVQAVKDFGIEVIIVGAEAQINEQLKQFSYDQQKVRVVNSTEIVEMNESPATALRQKKDSSIRVAVDLVKAGEADAIVSAGNTGASMATAKFVLKSVEGIERPAIASLMPSVHRNHPFVLLDVGANTDCKPLYLFQFALMGDAYARTYLHLDNPRVALLNVGEEDGKGYLDLKETFDLLKQSTLNFAGNIEGKAMFRDRVDVVVCDGFIGNIALKVAEGTFDFVRSILREEVQSSWLSKLGYLAMKGPFRQLRKRADYTEVGGAPLLGVNGVVIICHGSSKVHTLRNAIKHAQECAEQKLNDKIAVEVAENLEVIKQAKKMNGETN